ncbi:MAG: DUF4424 domain-containing protein [Rhizobiales bacterium]|nr:DUF4424 domain-containing protein [Hyphomicrobiales bacterium]
MNRPLAASLLFLAAFSPASANDSIATLGAGGLILIRADTISMEKEDLFISPGEVRVNYVFRNNDAADRTYLMAFPMPQIDPQQYLESDISVPERNKENFMNFAVTVDGAKVEPKLEMRALSGGLDVTDMVSALGVPLNPLADETRTALAAIPREKLGPLIAMGAVAVSDEGVSPAWSLKSTYYWQQNFPAKAPLAVAHTYTPAVGATFYYEDAGGDGNIAKDFCIDAGTAKAINSKIATGSKDSHYLMQRTIEYILTTGANWQGAIGDFRLVVDKGAPDAIVSFCMDGVKKISPTQFEVRKKDFYPTDELKILLLNSPSQ